MRNNPVTIQYFEWNLPADGKHWQRLKEDALHLKEIGVAAVWIPPAYKGMSFFDVGYGVYDKYDLGEFEQKGTVSTKYGTLNDLQEAIDTLHQAGISVYADTVLNHMGGADATETFNAVKVNPDNRDQQISDAYEIDGWTKFSFSGRDNKYSAFKWNYDCFTAVDFDQRRGEWGIYLLVGPGKQGFSPNVDKDKGNFDYLMFADIDYSNPAVVDETMHWGLWFIDKLQLDGLRLDALKHIDDTFIDDFIKQMREKSGRELYLVGEYWSGNAEVLKNYLDRVENYMALFDVALHFNFVDAGNQESEYDLRSIFADTLISYKPQNVMTFVDNHDSQPGQALESWVKDWFKPLAYALIMLRKDGYPCLFYGDYYGIAGDLPVDSKKQVLDPILYARQKYAYGEQVDFFTDKNCIAWLRKGDPGKDNSGLFCMLSNGDEQNRVYDLGSDFANQSFYDFTGNCSEIVTTDDHGSASFRCQAKSVSIWVKCDEKHDA